MESKSIGTQYGAAKYYRLMEEGSYTRVMVKFENEESENEFVIESFLVPDEERLGSAVQIYGAGYKQGRHRGMWEKAKKLKSLFDQIRMETL